MITIGEKYIKIDTPHTSLIFCRYGDLLETIYYGKRLADMSDYEMFSTHKRKYAHSCVDDVITANLTFSCYGMGYDGEFMLGIKNYDGGYANNFLFDCAFLCEQKITENFPCSRGAENTVCLVYKDKDYALELRQYYSVFSDTDTISVRNELVNLSAYPVRIDRFFSGQLDLYGAGYEIYTFRGAWGRERFQVKNRLECGVFSSGTVVGVSSHSANPFFMVRSPRNDWYSFNLVYSGNHKEIAEASPMGLTRIMWGMNDFGGEKILNVGESFVAPEAVFTYGESRSAAERSMHAFINGHIIPEKHRGKERPILLNVWGGLSYNFTEKDLKDYARAAIDLGMEGVVVDDGWFGARDSEKCALGDWRDNEKKTGGLKNFSRFLHENRLKFGVWIEPEMVSPDSDLFRKHPEWVMRNQKREPILMRNQLWLDITQKEVQSFVYESVANAIKESDADYIKWDCNRNVTDAYGLRGCDNDYGYRYYTAFYAVLERLTGEFPKVLFEGCAAGGGRFDLGVLHYMPQIWASDTTDARARVYIQEGTFAGYPQSVISAHAASSLFASLDRKTRLRDSFSVAVSCVFGYENDVRNLSDEEKKEIKTQIAFYKKHRLLIQYGENFLSESPFDSSVSVRTIVSADKSEAVAFLYKLENSFNIEQKKYFLSGLKNEYTYRVTCFGKERTFLAKGDALNSYGLDFNDFFTREWNGEYCSDIHTAVLYLDRADEDSSGK